MTDKLRNICEAHNTSTELFYNRLALAALDNEKKDRITLLSNRMRSNVNISRQKLDDLDCDIKTLESMSSKENLSDGDMLVCDTVNTKLHEHFIPEMEDIRKENNEIIEEIFNIVMS